MPQRNLNSTCAKKMRACSARGTNLERLELALSRQGTEESMTTLQAVAFGAMLTWTPSLIILAASLWDARELEGME